MGGSIALEVSDLCVEYPHEPVRIEQVSFAISSGTIFGITGESGSGKTTVCRALLGLLSGRASRWSGTIALDGRDITKLDASERRKLNGKEIAYIAQNPEAAFDPCMKIHGHFAETLRTHLRCSKRDARSYGERLLSKVGLSDARRIMKSYPYQLSGGMLQRVMIALALAFDPLLIVADEPTASLDARNAALISELLMRVSRELKLAMLLVSHDIQIMAEMADELAVMKDGRIIEQGNAKEVISMPQNEHTKELMGASASASCHA